jgi:hypothetical protein
VAGTCEYGKEPSGSIKCGEFLGKAGPVHAMKARRGEWRHGATAVAFLTSAIDGVGTNIV